MNKAQNDSSLDHAFNYFKQWTGPEMEIAMRPDIRVADLAAMLGRTVSAVVAIRSRLRKDPRLQMSANLEPTIRIALTKAQRPGDPACPT